MTTKRPIPKRPVAPAVNSAEAAPIDLTQSQVPPQQENAATWATERVDLFLNSDATGEVAERKSLAERFQRTNGGYLVAGVVLPFTFNAATTLDPLAEKILGDAFDHPDVDAEILAFHQHGYRVVISGHETINATVDGTYLVYEGHPESKSYVVYFLRLQRLDRVYMGTAEQATIDHERKIELSIDHAIRQEQIKIIAQTFQWAHELG